MQALDHIIQTFTDWKGHRPESITLLPPSGSNRTYARISDGGNQFIGMYNDNIPENNAFISFTKHFHKHNLPVPEIFFINKENTSYIQQDVGNKCLLDILEEKGHTNETYALFEQAVKTLVSIQITGDKGFPYEACLTAKEFGQQAIMSDLLYFKYYFLDTFELPYDKQALLDEFDALASYLHHTEYKYVMFRDFQSRNIMVDENYNLTCIDYQGAMKGALQYDLASFLRQAKAGLSEQRKQSLIQVYIQEANKLLHSTIDETIFTTQYYGFVLVRLLQVLGAYGFRGLFQGKAHFISSIPLALKNLRYLVENHSIGIAMPTFQSLLQTIINNDTIEKFTFPKATADTPLRVYIHSFSYKKGIPEDSSSNGGGFVFDCRGIDNPGRYDDYKQLSGNDKQVIDFLEQTTKMPVFLRGVYTTVDLTVETYLKRNFDSLHINFGCTGGQHRSVYAANETARHLKNKYNIHVELIHTNKDNRVGA